MALPPTSLSEIRKWHPTFHFSPSPDMNVSDAIDYIVNDSKAIFDKPKRSETPSGFHPGAKMLVVGALHVQARQFELSLREIPPSYWGDMQLDFNSALFYRGPYSQTTKIPGRTAMYNWADIKVNRSQIEARWPQKAVVIRLYERICKHRTTYKSGLQL